MGSVPSSHPQVHQAQALQESATLPSPKADGKGMEGGRQRPLPSAADDKRRRQRKDRQRPSLPSASRRERQRSLCHQRRTAKKADGNKFAVSPLGG